ncbi:Histidine phosphatase superfamily (branch 2) [Popillia japonica]|uniref:2-phosphoxylose phosphatase 1 n=1 Tax=Popillia japonica TaxID=7064 RepID=A0AAW1JUX7_POPJA
MFHGFLRVPVQHRVLYIVIIWILILIAGLYKYLEPRQRALEPVVTAELFHNLGIDIKTKRIFKICNSPRDIPIGDEGILEPKQWVLKGLLILIRHGDRGPLQHIRNISSINCGTPDTELLNSYKNYLHNSTISGKALWVTPAAFHGFPLLPTHNRQCQLGQLTMQGVNQHLQLGHILKQSYINIWPKLTNLSHHEISVYSTRYHRTFQSALAFLYGLVSVDTLSKLVVQESQSMYFCFKDCGCQISEKYMKLVQKDVAYQLKSHPAISLLAETTGRSIFSSSAENTKFQEDPHAVKDALLTYVCHGSSLPCETPTNCVRRQNVVGIFAYTDWVSHQKWKNWDWKRLCLLRSYGLIRHIVSQMLGMISSSGPYVVLYSGHDHTIEHLSTALGLQNDPLLLRYAARIVFEVYHNTSETQGGASGLYFRLLTNGKDVTKQYYNNGTP